MLTLGFIHEPMFVTERLVERGELRELATRETEHLLEDGA